MAGDSEKSIFLSALEFETPQDRQAYLNRACGADPRMRQAVDELLAAHERADNVLDSIPEPVGVFRANREPMSGGRTGGFRQTLGSERAQIAEGPGTVIGPYKLLEQIGEGGFGYVFVAEQQQPVRRRVALKIIKPGMDSREVIARFEAERQALALMEHPNIAQVYDAGTTDTGRPYFVMELVRGISVTEFCKESGISIGQRLELFINICNAVQHAHQKGIIHRDLKPPNVMVTLHDGTPVVKVIDFGVAKAMGEPLTAKTIYTRFTQVIGTPLYMSPEQIELSGLDVDTRSDIYSLGVLLYEMLTGATPFDSERLCSLSFDELRRIIREEEPPRPSLKLTTVRGRGLTVPSEREIASRTACAAVRGDLDWIVMKALEKDRRRRYETAAEFAADVRRYLNQEPIEARPPSPLYRFGKFARRNKVFLTTASLVLAALVLGTAVSTWQAVLALKARSEADALRQKAVEFGENLKQANILLDTARANADSERWETAYRQYTKAIELQPDHYPVWSGRATLLVQLGLWDLAAADYAKALALGASANSPRWWGVPQLFLHSGDVKTYRSSSAQILEQHKGSSDTLFTLIALRGVLVEPNPDVDMEECVQLLESLLRQERQEPRYRERFGMAPRHGRDEPWDRDSDPPPGPPPSRESGGPHGFRLPRELLFYTTGLAHYRAGHLKTAVDYLRESAKSDPRNPAQAAAYPVLAMAYHRTGQSEEARSALTEASNVFDRWLDTWGKASIGSLPQPWFDFIEYQLLHREATQLITGSPPDEDVRLDGLKHRALEAIGLQ